MTSSSGTYDKSGRTAFKICGLWILMRFLTYRGPHRSAYRWQKRRIKGIIYRHVSIKSVSYLPFFGSVNRILGADSKAMLKLIASCLVAKWRQSYYCICGYVKIRVTITMVRNTCWCIQGSQETMIWIIIHQPQWEDGDGINLYW